MDVERIVKQIENADINVMANYIYGLPGDTRETIEETFKLSKNLNTLGWNTYAAMALPGSQLYKEAKDKGKKLPTDYDQFSFHSYKTRPLSTEKLHDFEILELRDLKFNEYFSSNNFHLKITNKFGKVASENIKSMLKIKLKREIIENKN